MSEVMCIARYTSVCVCVCASMYVYVRGWVYLVRRGRHDKEDVSVMLLLFARFHVDRYA